MNELEVWKDEGRNLVLVRCPRCWRAMARDGLVDNNGWFQPDHYPHAHWCPTKNRREAIFAPGSPALSVIRGEAA